MKNLTEHQNPSAVVFEKIHLGNKTGKCPNCSCSENSDQLCYQVDTLVTIFLENKDNLNKKYAVEFLIIILNDADLQDRIRIATLYHLKNHLDEISDDAKKAVEEFEKNNANAKICSKEQSLLNH